MRRIWGFRRGRWSICRLRWKRIRRFSRVWEPSQCVRSELLVYPGAIGLRPCDWNRSYGNDDRVDKLRRMKECAQEDTLVGKPEISAGPAATLDSYKYRISPRRYSRCTSLTLLSKTRSAWQELGGRYALRKQATPRSPWTGV